MNCYFSRNEIDSFARHVVCLKLMSDTRDLKYADIKWECNSDILRIRTFHGDGEFDFSDGVLLSLDKVGVATVTATLDGVRYECRVNIREPKSASREDKLNFYIGDFHDHSSWDHSQSGFPRREKDFPIDIINAVVKDGRLDFAVLSDHGSIMQNTDLFRAFFDEDRADTGDVIVFPGSESECVDCHTDKFGNPQRVSGEFVTVNSADFIFSDNFEKVNEVLGRNPYAVVSIAHPNTWTTKYGGGCMMTPRLYNSAAIPEWHRAVKLFEMGNGTDRGTTILFEPTLSLALDLGYKVCPVCTSDCHGTNPNMPSEPEWGYDAWPGKTVIMAPEKSKEAFLDALVNHRVYGTENGNTALYYTVNEGRCGDTLKLTNIYNFHVEIGKIKDIETAPTVRVEVISDYGMRVKTIENVDFSSFDFTVESDTARYFFLRVIDENGLKTWSAPVWTGRAPDIELCDDGLSVLDSGSFTATDGDGSDASLLFSGNPADIWYSDKCSDTVTVDMKTEREVCAITLHAPCYNLLELRKTKTPDTPLIATYPAEYRISVSADGEKYTTLSEGLMRTFGIGYTVHFDTVCARFIRLELLSTVGKYSCRPEHKDAKITLGHIEILR